MIGYVLLALAAALLAAGPLFLFPLLTAKAGEGFAPQAAPWSVPYSGPVTVPLEEESPAIRRAPAYDREMARELIRDLPKVQKILSGEFPEELSCFGEARPGEEALARLQREIEELSKDTHLVSLIMVDLKTLSGVSYQPDEPMCSQSTVKAPYIGALLEGRPLSKEENGAYMRLAAEFSSNEAYDALRRIYGRQPLDKWCHEIGVEISFAREDYPRDKTARDMLRLWVRLYEFLNAKEEGLWLGRYLADSSCSAAKKVLGERFAVQTKAGWEHGLPEEHNFDPQAEIPRKYRDGDPLNDECAINDTGIVYTDRGPYLFVIYTDHPFGVFQDHVTPNPLYPLTEALFEVHRSLSEE